MNIELCSIYMTQLGRKIDFTTIVERWLPERSGTVSRIHQESRSHSCVYTIFLHLNEESEILAQISSEPRAKIPYCARWGGEPILTQKKREKLDKVEGEDR